MRHVYLCILCALSLGVVSGCAVIDDEFDGPDKKKKGGASVPATLTLEGRAFDPISQHSVIGASVEIYDRQTDALLGSTTTAGSNGEYSITLSTGGRGLDVYFVTSATGFTTTRLYPPEPITQDVEVCPPFAGTIDCLSLALLTPGARAFIASQGGVTIDPARAEILYIAAGCDGQPRAGLTAKFRPKGGEVRYASGPFPDASRSDTDPFGRIFAYNLPPGNIKIKARDGNKLFAKTKVDALAGESTIVSTLPKRCP